MLILSRKSDQAIVIDDDIVVRVLAVEGERVKIGIEAPASVIVKREELLTEAPARRPAPAPSTGRRGPHLRVVRASGE